MKNVLEAGREFRIPGKNFWCQQFLKQPPNRAEVDTDWGWWVVDIRRRTDKFTRCETFWTFLNMFNIFKHFLQFIDGCLQMSWGWSIYSSDIEYLFYFSMKHQYHEENRHMHQISNILYLHFKLWKIIVSRKIDISNRYQQFLFPLKTHWARKSKAWDCSFLLELSKLKFMHTYCWMSTPLWSEQQLHITSGCKPIGQIYLSKHGILVKFVLFMGKVYIGRTCIYRHMILKIKSWTAMISSETKFCSISNFKGENLSGGYIWHWQLVSSLREVYWGVKGDSGQIEWSFYYRQRLMLSINVQ